MRVAIVTSKREYELRYPRVYAELGAKLSGTLHRVIIHRRS